MVTKVARVAREGKAVSVAGMSSRLGWPGC